MKARELAELLNEYPGLEVIESSFLSDIKPKLKKSVLDINCAVTGKQLVKKGDKYILIDQKN